MCIVSEGSVVLMQKFLQKIPECIFQSPAKGIGYKIPGLFFLTLLFFAGALYWALFFNLGSMHFKAYDWPKEYKYYSVLQKSLKTGCLPYYISESFHDTNRFLAIPETVLSPQVLLLGCLDVNWFLIAHIIILYAIGYLGCLMIKKRFQLSFFSFGILYLLFNFNGHITSHLAIGHSMWGGYFLLPYFFLFIFKLVEGDFSNLNLFTLSFTLFFILLQGSFHIYVWCLIFLLLLCLSRRGYYIKPVFFTILISMLFSACRLFPAIVTFFWTKHVFISGYHTIRILLDSLITIRPHSYQLGILKGEGYLAPGWWEYDLYIGILGVVFILYGIYRHFFKNNNSIYKDLNIPIIGQTILSLGAFYLFINILPLPFISSERVSTRFLIIPLLLLTVLTCIYFQRMLDNYGLIKKPGLTFFALIGIIQMAYSLAVHSVTWSLMTIEKGFQASLVDLSIPKILTGQQVENAYILSLKAGTIISVVTLLVFLGLIFYPQLLRFNLKAK